MKPRIILPVLLVTIATVLAGCGGDGETGKPALGELSNPEGRVIIANQDADTISVIDVATNRAYTAIATGKRPHHVLATPDSKEFWVTLYGENRMQVFDAQSLKEAASVDVGSPNDDLIFNPAGDRLYVSLGQKDQVVVIDVPNRKVVGQVSVGKTPHGLKVTADGKYLLAANTLDNTISLISLEGEPKVEATIKTGVNPFEVTVTNDGATAYVSNFLGDSISVVDLKTRKTVGYIRSGKKPAMLALQEGAGGAKLWVANTGSNDLWQIEAGTRKLITRIPVGRGAHGALPTPSGKLYVTNTQDNTITVIDEATAQVLTTLPVGNYPNGITYLPATPNP